MRAIFLRQQHPAYISQHFTYIFKRCVYIIVPGVYVLERHIQTSPPKMYTSPNNYRTSPTMPSALPECRSEGRSGCGINIPSSIGRPAPPGHNSLNNLLRRMEFALNLPIRCSLNLFLFKAYQPRSPSKTCLRDHLDSSFFRISKCGTLHLSGFAIEAIAMTKTLIENLNKTRKKHTKMKRESILGHQKTFSMLSHFLPLCVLSHRFCDISKNFPPKRH